MQKTLGWLEATIELILFSKAAIISARCLEHSSRGFAVIIRLCENKVVDADEDIWCRLS